MRTTVNMVLGPLDHPAVERLGADAGIEGDEPGFCAPTTATRG